MLTTMKSSATRHLIHALILALGLVLMTGGIITGIHGATVIGIIVSGVSVHQWIQWYRKAKNTESQGVK